MKKRIAWLAMALALSACGGREGEPVAASPVAATPVVASAAASAPAASTAADGATVYRQLCSNCHKLGIAGAPKLGDSADWAPRIAQGIEVLYEHSVKGYTGPKGLMPAKGGNPALSDTKVRAAVDYMIDNSRTDDSTQ
ncbi:MAG TPA: c-type cytochrome [Steroidobacteraceae bacterium]|nr:c-type cytochrome [Steroidobacteraceae bacterium]